MTAITAAEVMAAFPGLTASTRNDADIAATMSQGRTQTISPTYIGVGHVLSTLGPTAGAAFLDAVNTAAASNSVFKYGLQMLGNDTFDIGNPVTVAQINAMVPALLTATQAANLIALGVFPDPVTPQMVDNALAGYPLPP